MSDELRKELEAAILARLEAKSTHEYRWPRWAASEEASEAVAALVGSLLADAWDEGWYSATNGKWGSPDPNENPYRRAA